MLGSPPKPVADQAVRTAAFPTEMARSHEPPVTGLLCHVLSCSSWCLQPKCPALHGQTVIWDAVDPHCNIGPAALHAIIPSSLMFANSQAGYRMALPM